MERIGGRRDGHIEFSAFFNKATDQAHLALRGLPTADRFVSYLRGTTLGADAASMRAKQLNYDPTRDDDGNLAFKVTADGSGLGLDWGRLLAPKRTDTGAGNTTGLDELAPSTFGAQLYLHVFAFTGTDVHFKVQHSTDNGGGDPYADVGGTEFTVTAPGAQRLAIPAPGTIDRWVRVAITTVGGFTSVTWALVWVRNPIAVVF
jgi:hypothetical protein